MAALSVESIVSDERWALVKPLLPALRRRPPAHRQVDPRAAFAAVVYTVTAIPFPNWNDIPDVFGIAPNTAYRRFLSWTDADLWRKLATAGIDTPHALWTWTAASAATRRAGNRAPGYPDATVAALPAEPADNAEPAVAEPPQRRVYLRYSTDDYAAARASLNRHDGTA